MSNTTDNQKEEEGLQKELQTLDSCVKLDARLASHLDHIEQCMRAVLAGSFGTPLKRNFFVRQTIPKIVVTILKRGDLDDDEASRANQFFQLVLSFIVKFIPEDALELLETLNRLLTSTNNTFYMKYGKDEASRESMYAFDDEPEFIALSRTARWDVSVFLLSNVNWFGSVGGFTSILDRLRNTEPKPSLSVVKLLVKPAFKVRELLHPNFLKSYVDELTKLVFEYVLKLSDEEMKNEDKKLITDVSAAIDGLLHLTMPNKANECIEQFNLQVALKCFRSPYLEKRLAGLNDIKEFISAVGRKSEMRNKMGNKDRMPNNTQYAWGPLWIDSNYLIAWLRDNQILEHLYGQNMHPELIRRCIDIPKFLALEGKLEKQHLDLIWDASEGKHESISHHIYFSVGELAAHLSLEDIDYLYEKIRSIPLTSYSAQTVQLIRTFTAHAINSSINTSVKTKNWYGLTILWDLIQDTAGVSSDVAFQALAFLNDFLQWQFCNAQRGPFMESCLANLQEHRSVCMSLKLLNRIIDSFYTKRKKGDISVPGIISWLEETHNLRELIFSDIVHYKKTVASAAIENADGGDGKQVATFWQQHIQQIKDRLDFLDYILSNSKLKLDVRHVDVFWDCLILNALTTDERNIAFSWWLDSSRSSQSFEIPLTDDCVHHLFVNRVPQMDFASLSKEGFSFFEYFFRYVNSRGDKLDLIDKSFIVTSFDLLGLDSLWKIALEARDQFVAKQAIILLNKLHKHIAPSLSDNLSQQREEYISTCMQHLAVASDQLSTCIKQQQQQVQDAASKDAELHVVRCLTLLRSILDEFETRTGAMRQRHGSSTRGIPLTLQVIVLQGPRFTLQVHSNELVGALRAKISERQECLPHLIRLITAGKELKYDAESLSECKISHMQQIHVTRRLAKDEDGKIITDLQPPVQNQEDLKAYPSNILSTQKYFNQLFHLLALSETVGQRVWDLLMMLPTNRQILTDLASLRANSENGQVAWDDLLDPRSTFKLLYSLQIVDSFLQSETIPATDLAVEKSSAWCVRLLAAGGVKHLLNIVMTVSPDNFYGPARGSKSKACMAFLLKIIGIFVTAPTSTSTVPLLNGTVLASYVDPLAFVKRLLELMWNAAGGNPHQHQEGEHSNGTTAVTTYENPPDSEDGDVVRHAMSLLVAAALSRTDLLAAVLNHSSFPLWLASLVLFTPEETIRKEATIGVYALCTVAEDTSRINVQSHTFFLHQFLALLPNINSKSPTCEQYFELLNKLVKDSCEGLVAGTGPHNFTKLLEELIVMVKLHPIVETRNGVEEDKVLIGLLNLVKTLVSKEPEFKMAAGYVTRGDLIHHVVHQCLFEIPTAENHGPLAPPKCKTRASRNVAFQLLLELSRDCEDNFRVLTNLLMEHHRPDERRTQWQYLPSGYEKASCGYVGLKNLGATCYMNSLIQQLFMIPAFRYSMFAVEDREESKADSLLFQLQVIFAHLQETEKKYYDTRDFCNAYKCDGQPTNTSVQMDVDEFFNMLFDKLENALKGTKQENLLKDFFGGTNINQVISKGCGHVSEREEGFFTISVEVKNKKTILESLELYVEGDMLEGDNKYFCSTCATKVDALKRCCIKTLPNTLIIHSKRFDFDVELMKRTKLNDLCEFPSHLNMEPYTKEGLARLEAKDNPPEPLHPPEYYEYELSGILVHHGTADSGHYYSFIKERRNGPWYQFNDVQVDPFNTDEIAKACFGGVETVTQWDSQQQKHVTRVQPRVYNAYMLFYDRVRPERIAHCPNITPNQAAGLVPQSIFNYVWEENMKFLNDKNIFDVDYFSFLWALVSLGPMPTSSSMMTGITSGDGKSVEVEVEVDGAEFDQTLQNIQLGTRFIVETLAHAKEKTSFRDCVQYLKGLYSRHPVGCRWFLETMTTDTTWIKQMLLICTISETREVFANLVVHVISCLMPYERDLYFEVEPSSPLTSVNEVEATTEAGGKQTSGGKQKAATQAIDGGDPFVPVSGRPKSLVIRFMDAYIGLLKEAHHHWRHFAQYFLVLRDFANLGPVERKYMLQRSLITQMIDFYLGDESPFSKAHHVPKKTKMGDKFNLPHLQHMVELIAILARGCFTRLSLTPPSTSLLGELLRMGEIDTEMLYCQEFYAKVIRENISTRATSDIINHICWEDKKATKKVIETIRQAIHDVDFEGFKPYFDVFGPLLALNDSLQVERVDDALTSYLGVIDANLKYKNATLHAIRFLVDLVPENYVVRQWMFDHLDVWAERWMLASTSELARESAVLLAMHLIPQHPSLIPTYNLNINQVGVNGNGTGPQPYGPQFQPGPTLDLAINTHAQPISVEATTMLHTLFTHLLSLMRSARGYCTRDESKGMMDDMLSKSFWRLHSYARLLRWCVTGPEERTLFIPYQADFIQLLLHVDAFHFESDENKAELVRFWVHVLQGNHEAIRLAAENDKSTTRLMDYFISMRPRQYNKVSLPAFYQVLLMFCDHDCFLNKIAMHHNFEWAIKSLYLDSSEYTMVAEALFNIMRRCGPIQAFRSRFIHITSQYDKFYHNAENILRFLDLLLHDTDDSVFFCISDNLEHVSRFVVLRQERDLEMEETYPIICLALDILVRGTNWLLNPPTECSNGANVSEALDSVAEKWDKQSLLSALLSFMDHLPFAANPQLAGLCHRMIDILCTTDPACLVIVLRYMHDQFVSRDAMQTSRFSSHHHQHAPLLMDDNNLNHTPPEVIYYGFMPRFIHTVLAIGDSEQAPSAIDLAVLVAKEILLLPSPPPAVLLPVIPLLKFIWEHAEHGKILRENRRLDVYVALVLTNGHQYLDNPAFVDLIAMIFPHVACHMPPNHRETIVRQLAEKVRYFIVYTNQAINSLNQQQQDNNNNQSRLETAFASLVQSLKALSVIFTDAATKAQFIHENSQLITSVADMARSLAEEEAKTGDSSAATPPAGGSAGSHLKSLPRASDFAKLAASLTQS